MYKHSPTSDLKERLFCECVSAKLGFALDGIVTADGSHGVYVLSRKNFRLILVTFEQRHEKLTENVDQTCCSVHKIVLV